MNDWTQTSLEMPEVHSCAPVNTCKIDGCDGVTGGPGTARGWCGKHYQRWYTHGDPMYVRPRKCDDQCTVADCDGLNRGHGFCSKHYDRWRTHGDPLYVRPRAGDEQCKVADCVRLAKSRGWCTKHYERWLTHGDPLFVREPVNAGQCSVEGCDGARNVRTWCKSHYYKWQRYGDPLFVFVRAPANEGPCKIDDCERPAFLRQWCKMHYLRWQRHGDPLYVKSPAPKVECSVDDCERIAGGSGSARGLCSKHYSREWELMRSYGISVSQFDSMLTAQGGVCAGCGADSPGSGQWHVDHDHLTNVVRGVLCGTCNWALGNVRDNPATLLGLAAYLESSF